MKPADTPADSSPVTLMEENWAGLQIARYRENISAGVEWPIMDERHTLVLHLGGTMNRLESELEGSGSIRGGATTGEVWSIPQHHRYSTSAEGGVISYAVIKIDPAVFGKSLGSKATNIELEGFLGRFDPFLLQAVGRLGEMAHRTGDLAALGSEQLARAIGTHVLLHYRESSDRSVFVRRRNSDLPLKAVKRLTEFIHDNLAERITLSMLADVAGMNEHQLLSGFRQEFGTTPMQYVLDQRLRLAQAHLARTGLTIIQIAMKSGFSSHSHLTRAMKDRTGLTPSAFRSAT